MAHSISAAPLLFLSLLVSTCYGVDPLCVTNYSPSNNTSSNSNFTLTVSPGTLLNNTKYSVSVNGTGNGFTVTLQAVSIPVGNWPNCSGSLQFTNVSLTNSIIQGNWTSPANVTGVMNITINAYIAMDNQTYLISKVLSPAANTPATSAPATQSAFVSASNSTGNSTNAPSNNITVPADTKTTSGGSSYHSSLISTAGIQILFLFMISKYLS